MPYLLDRVEGEDGVGIKTTIDNGDGTFTLFYTDGTSFTTSDFTGNPGLDGHQVRALIRYG